MRIRLDRVLVAIDGKIAGSFAVTDPVKPEAARVISYLHLMNFTSIMVTTDNWASGAAIAKEVGIDKVSAETDPLEKLIESKKYSYDYTIVTGVIKGMAVTMVGATWKMLAWQLVLLPT
ncbi:copper-transporting ATPase HMA5 [Pyrus ussuriensis x Pyrus communis]|uniref:Copper-transporting ATPase HMA5 n=1 Tax=Pyrus ussuriensis x Pyrus communis TaxID=2448454 RepID=A0A5N5GJ90_9ROSA|nr:copper-transporting ATPase HMA5 [Pyrus ussuriensis x Pyrus communis]